MRSILKTVTVVEQVSNQYTATEEELSTISENKINKFIAVTVSQKDMDGKTLLTYNYTIIGDKYTQIMSASPSFALDKPENEYRESDLWYMIDQIRAEQGHD